MIAVLGVFAQGPTVILSSSDFDRVFTKSSRKAPMTLS
jgi:hypothetical protein